jgi:hypothetical protein
VSAHVRHAMLRAAVALVCACAVAVTVACAPLPPPSQQTPPPRSTSPTTAPTSPSSPVAQATPPAPSSPRPAANTNAATRTRPLTPADSLPSPEAMRVLDTMPEPLAPGERVSPPRGVRIIEPPPRSLATPVSVADSTAAPDTSTVADSTFAEPAASDSSVTESAQPDSVTSDVPMPSPTQPLGDRPGTLTLRDSVTTPPVMPAAPPDTTVRPKAAAVDSCWRLQIAAPPERARAEAMRDAAQSQLLLPMVIEKENNRFKVRTRDCLASSATADSLKRRATASGFSGAFRIVEKKR